MSLLKAIRNYDSTKGSSLKSYIFYSVVHGLINLANEGQEYSITERCRLKRLNELQEEYAYMHENLTDDIIIEELELKSKKELIHILSLQKSMNKIRIDDEENSIDILDDDKKKETINTINEMLFGLNEIESAVVKAETNIKYFDDKKMVCEKYNLSEEKYNEILNDSRKKLEKVLRKD